MSCLDEFDAIFFLPKDNDRIHIQSNVYKDKGTPIEGNAVGDKWHVILFRIDEEVEDEGPEFDGAGYSEEDRFERREDAKYEKAFSHFVDNDEADEDAQGPTLYYRPKQQSEKFNGVSQKILDYVERTGNVSYKMLNDFYRQYTNGSNSLSHILKALTIPYKNRPTRRFLRQIARGTYAIDYATQYNWVENDVYDYND